MIMAQREPDTSATLSSMPTPGLMSAQDAGSLLDAGAGSCASTAARRLWPPTTTASARCAPGSPFCKCLAWEGNPFWHMLPGY